MVWVAQNRYNEEDFKVQAQVWAARIKQVTSKQHLQISSIIYASSRLDGVVDLAMLKEMFKEKYGQLYVDRASRDSTCDACEVPQDLRKFLQLEAFTPEEKLALLVEIGNKKAIKWDVAPLTELLGIQHTLPQRQPL